MDSAAMIKPEILQSYLHRLNNARHGEKGRILAEALEQTGLSRASFYRALEKLGYSKDKTRKTRKDAGSTSQSQQATDFIAALMVTGQRKNGKQITHVTDAVEIAQANGYECKSLGTVYRHLRAQQATAKQLSSDPARIKLKSLYPNHVHQVDPSLCLLYYPPGKNGKTKVKIQHYMNEEDFNKNKPHNLEKIKHYRVWRYVLTDHTSSVIRTRYYESAGETTANLYDFLLWCWGLHNDPHCPMRGLPVILMMDKGSAGTSKAMIRVLEQSFNVKVITHEKGRANAKGQVEQGNNLVETKFESRLNYEPVDSVDDLNRVAIVWQNRFNAGLIDGSKHSRHGEFRYAHWQKHMQHRVIRDLPDEKVCRYLLLHKEDTRVVDHFLQISFVHPAIGQSRQYNLSGLAGIYKNLKVLVLPMALTDCGEIMVVCKFEGEDQFHKVVPIEKDAHGFDVDAPVIGEKMQAHPDTLVDTRRKQALRNAYPNLTDDEIKKALQDKKKLPFEGKVRAHSHLGEIEMADAFQNKGEAIQTGFEHEEQWLSGLALKQAIVKQRGGPVTPDESNYLADRTIKANELNALVRELEQRQHPPQDNTVVNLKRS